MTPLWFKAKRYGLGWQPATWQGWTVLLVYVVLVIGNALRFNDRLALGNHDLSRFLLETIGLTIVLLAICYATGEPLRWRWGNEK